MTAFPVWPRNVSCLMSLGKNITERGWAGGRRALNQWSLSYNTRGLRRALQAHGPEVFRYTLLVGRSRSEGLAALYPPIKPSVLQHPSGSTAKTFANALISKYAGPPLEWLTLPKPQLSGFFRKTHSLTSTAAPGESLQYPSPTHTVLALTATARKETKILPTHAGALAHAHKDDGPSMAQLSSAPRSPPHQCFCSDLKKQSGVSLVGDQK